MSHELKLTSQAYEDLVEAIAWYQQQQGLADQFLKEVDSPLSLIAKYP